MNPTKRKKSDDPDERVVEALEKALEATKPDKAGTPWEAREKRDERPDGYWFPGSED